MIRWLNKINGKFVKPRYSRFWKLTNEKILMLSWVYVTDEHMDVVAILPAKGRGEELDERSAMIAAAPEMLDMLAEAAKTGSVNIEHARSLVAKARGLPEDPSAVAHRTLPKLKSFYERPYRKLPEGFVK